MEHDYPLLKKLGLGIANFSLGPAPLRVEKEMSVLSVRHPQKSALAALGVTLTDIEQMADMLDIDPKAVGETQTDLAGFDTTQTWEQIDAQAVARLRRGLFQHVAGNRSLPKALKTEISRHFFPMPISVFAAKDIYVKTGTIFCIGSEDHDPMVCDFGTVTLEEGGKIEVRAPAMINIGTFKKVAATL